MSNRSVLKSVSAVDLVRKQHQALMFESSKLRFVKEAAAF